MSGLTCHRLGRGVHPNERRPAGYSLVLTTREVGGDLGIRLVVSPTELGSDQSSHGRSGWAALATPYVNPPMSMAAPSVATTVRHAALRRSRIVALTTNSALKTATTMPSHNLDTMP